jgi:hypothetical protein
LKASHSAEAAGARLGTYGTSLRRLYKRREALRSAQPYLVAIVAVADDYMYADGHLCYTDERSLRIVNLHHPDGTESVIDVRQLLDHAIVGSEEAKRSQFYTFKPLHLAHGILSCLYSHSFGGVQSHWLVVVDIASRCLLLSHSLQSASKIFVRNSESYLVCGTHSSSGRDHHRCWYLKVYNIQTKQSWGRKIDHFSGSDVNATVCFELFDGHCYGVSSQSSGEIREIDSDSYYTCFRFALHDHGLESIGRLERQRLWRRDHREGILDDRWTFLRLFKDSATGQLRILEARKEHGVGHTSWQRNYYMDDLSCSDFETSPAAIAKARESSSRRPTGVKRNTEVHSSHSRLIPRNIADDLANNTSLYKKRAREVHRGDDASTEPLFTLSKVNIRSYHPICQTWMDLVDGADDDFGATSCFRIRSGTRRSLSSFAIGREPGALVQSAGVPGAAVEDDSASLSRSAGVRFWPPLSAAYKSVREILNPPGYSGTVTTAWDDRSLVYGIKNDQNFTYSYESDAKVKMAVVFVSFDPCVRLGGIARFSQVQEPPLAGNGTDEAGSEGIPSPTTLRKDLRTAPPSASCTSGGAVWQMSKDLSVSMPSVPASDKPRGDAWLREDRATYLDIRRGYYFGLDRAQ